MATANIKITALNDITSANMTYNDLVAVVDMNGTPETKKANIQLVGNLILNGAGGSYFSAAAQAVLAQSVTNAAQPNITSVGTLSSLAVTANVTAGNLVSSGTVNGVLVGEGGNISNVQVGNVAGIGNIATINLDGNVSNVFRGDGTFGPEGAGGNANYANFAGTAYAVDGANVSGEVGFAAVANSVALANVSSAGNIASINLDGNVSNVLRGDGTWDSDANSTYGDSNVVSLLGAFGSNTILTTGLITGDAGGLSNVIGANVTGEVSFAATANAVAGANVSGEVSFAATANAVAVGNVSGIGNVATVNLDGNVSNVLRGDGTFAADSEGSYGDSNVVSLLGSFGSNTISTTGLITGDGGGLSNVPYANVTGTPTLGNISTINLDGNVSNVLRGDGSFGADANSSYGDSNVVSLLGSFGSNTITTTGLITGDGGGLSNIAVANVTGLGNIATTNFDGNAANYLDGTGSWGAITLSGDAGNLSNIVGANVSGEVSFAATANAVALGNVSGAGNIASINLDGNVSNVLRGDGTFAPDSEGSYGDSNVVSLLGAFGSNTISTTGNVGVGTLLGSNGATFLSTADNQFVVERDNGTSFRFKGNDFAGNVIQTYAGIFYNDVYGNASATKTRLVIGSNEDASFELQTSNEMRISAVDDNTGGGKVRIASGDGNGSPYAIEFHPGTQAEVDNLVAKIDVGGLEVTGNISGTGYVTAQRIITDPAPLANLTAVAGGRAFISDGNLVAAGNFGEQVGGGGANIVPVYSDGTNWYIG